MKYVFHINDIGDRSVGIFPAFSKVTIETPIIFEPSDIENIRLDLAETFDVTLKDVLTDDEARAEEEAEREYEKKLDQL